ncbi:MAG: uroporphyrinogen-III C-methyltransferase [Actinobacteria bacterium]|nr:uroporphyrinogen-III C-methyltransferase [Actinomycetota bacterium]
MTVYLVGAGPGDPGLLTVRGRELLSRADVVVYDRLASPRLLDLAPESAERIDVGKAPDRASLGQAEINTLLVERGRGADTVVRLKGGDPFVFGRGGEEAEALAAAGIPFEVVPGVTSAVAAAAYAGIPVTHRGVSTHVTVVTGHEDPAKGETTVDWAALAAAGGTLVILMGAGRLGEITAGLLAGGLPADTPATAVRWGTTPRQQTVRAALGTIADAAIEAPAAVIVGDVAALDLSWFERRPLFGRRIAVTRAREQASELRARLEELGAEAVEVPAIVVKPKPFDLPDLGSYGWLVFTSANGVDAFFDRGLMPAGLDTRALGALRVAAIGPGTAERLRQRGVEADLMPERFVAESLVEAFPPPAGADEGVLIARAAAARDVLPDGLAERGYRVDILEVYETFAAEPDPEVVDWVRRGEVDAITFTSSSTVTNLMAVLGGVPDPQPAVVAIGPVTAETARETGLRVDAVATEHTIDGLVRALVDLLAG